MGKKTRWSMDWGRVGCVLLGWVCVAGVPSTLSAQGIALHGVESIRSNQSSERPLLPMRSMEQIDLRVPGLGELSQADAANRVSIPNYAQEAMPTSSHETLGWGGSRPWNTSIVTWDAPALCHRPLYFEEANLERYGHSFGLLQPAVSAGDAFGRVLALPYLMTVQPPRRCVYTLGPPRPGDPVPYLCHHPRLSLPASAVEAAAIVGLVFLIP